MPEIEEVSFVDRETIMEKLMDVADECSTWISESYLTAEDKELSVVLLAEISGARTYPG